MSYLTYMFNININWKIIHFFWIFNFKELLKESLGLFLILFYFNEYLYVYLFILSHCRIKVTLEITFKNIFRILLIRKPNLVSYLIVVIIYRLIMCVFSGTFLKYQWTLLITRWSKERSLYLWNCILWILAFIIHWLYKWNILQWFIILVILIDASVWLKVIIFAERILGEKWFLERNWVLRNWASGRSWRLWIWF